MSSQSASLFFTKLPREIRDQIYDEIWLSTPPIIFTSPHIGVCEILYEGQHVGADEHPQLSWLRSCKQMYGEGMEQQYRKSVGRQGTTGPVETPSNEPNHPGEGMLLRCKELHLGLNTFLTLDMAGDMAFREAWIIAECDKVMLGKLRRWRRRIAPAWKKVTVHMMLNYEAPDIGSFDSFWNTFPAIDWHYLKNLLAGCELNSFNMEIRHWCPGSTCWGFYCPLLSMESVFAGELSAFGRSLVRRARVERSEIGERNWPQTWVYQIEV